MTTTTTAHVLQDEHGVAWIDDTNVKVREVIADYLAHASSPDEISFQYPHLSLAQIYAALSYYHDHQAEIERQIDEDTSFADGVRESCGSPRGRDKLRALGKLP